MVKKVATSGAELTAMKAMKVAKAPKAPKEPKEDNEPTEPKQTKTPKQPKKTNTNAVRRAMLGYLSYNAPTNETAKNAREVYDNLDMAQKQNFIDKWRNTKDKKNLGWVKDFEETLDKSKQFSRTKENGLLTRLACIALIRECDSSHL